MWQPYGLSLLIYSNRPPNEHLQAVIVLGGLILGALSLSLSWIYAFYRIPRFPLFVST